MKVKNLEVNKVYLNTMGNISVPYKKDSECVYLISENFTLWSIALDHRDVSYSKYHMSISQFKRLMFERLKSYSSFDHFGNKAAARIILSGLGEDTIRSNKLLLII